MMQDYRYRAFISYSHHDSAWVDWLQRALESYAVPSRLVGLKTEAGVIPARLAPIFRDRDELPSATDLSREVDDVLAQSACLIVVCSPHAAQSHWVEQEVRAFQRLGRAHRIFCVIVAGEPGASAWAGREHDECFVPALRQRFDATGNATGERLDPVAADARPHRDGKTNVRLKLIAGMLGIDLDDLKHRERRRRHWRLTALAAVVIALLSLTTTLAVNALIARNAAERRQKQAEDLVGFMLGDLDDKLRQVNRLDILESVADKAVKYFDSLPTADMTDDTLAQRAKALLKLGAVRRDQGRVPESVGAFNRALMLTEQLIRNAPDNPDFESINAEALTWLGFVDWSQGRLDEALKRFVAARDVLLRISTQRPDDTDVLDRLGSVRTNAGRVFEARGQMEEAKREYASVLDGYRYLSRREPSVLAWRTELGYAYNNLAQLALKEGRLDEAVQQYVEDREIKARLFALDPSNNSRREDLVASEAFLGRALYLCGETKVAATHLRAAMEGIEALLLIDSESTDWLVRAGTYGWMMGQLARTSSDAREAETFDVASVARLTQLVRKDSGNVGWQRALAQAQIENARRLLANDRLEAAKESATAASQAIAHSLASAPEDTTNQLVTAQAWIVRGDVASASGSTDEADAQWASGSAALRSLPATSRNPAVLDALVSVHLRRGESDEVETAIRSLERAGYRDPDFIELLEKHHVPYAPDPEVARRIARVLSETPSKS